MVSGPLKSGDLFGKIIRRAAPTSIDKAGATSLVPENAACRSMAVIAQGRKNSSKAAAVASGFSSARKCPESIGLPMTSLAQSFQIASGRILARDSGGAPEREHRRRYLVARGVIDLVIGEIGGLAGAVILAGGVDAQRIGEESAIMRERARIEGREVLRLGPARHLVVEIFDRGLFDQHFRHRIFLREKCPVPDLHGEACGPSAFHIS